MSRHKLLSWLPSITRAQALDLGKRLAPWALVLGTMVSSTSLLSCKQDDSHGLNAANASALTAVVVEIAAARADIANLKTVVEREHDDTVQRFRDIEARMWKK